MQTGKLIDDAGRCLNGPQDIANEFNDYFSSVFAVENTACIPDPVKMFHASEEDRLRTIELSVEDVIKALSRIRQDKSGGPDDVSPRLLANIYEELGRPLQMLFKKSMEEGRVPEDWKRANVCPISKKAAGMRRRILGQSV